MKLRHTTTKKTSLPLQNGIVSRKPIGKLPHGNAIYYPSRKIVDLKRGERTTMNMFRMALLNEQRRIQRLEEISAPRENKKPGSLTLEERNGNIYCYEQHYKGRKRIKKKYLGTLDSEPVRRNLDDRLRRERLKRMEADQKLLEKVEKQYLDYDRESIVAGLPRAYQLAACRDSFDERYEEVRRWANGDYQRNSAPFSEAATYAKDGTHVRSKGECIYYNMLQEHGLLFVYDCYITFTNKWGEKRNFCPDFVIRCLDGTLIIIEHLGRLHDKKYALDFGEKCHWYIQQGFVLGKNFFVTSDDFNGGTDSQAIMEVIQKVERMFYGY